MQNEEKFIFFSYVGPVKFFDHGNGNSKTQCSGLNEKLFKFNHMEK